MAGNFDRKLRLPRIHFRVLLHTRKYATWDKRLYFSSEGRRAEIFSPWKIRRLRPGFNPRTWVQKILNGTRTCFVCESGTWEREFEKHWHTHPISARRILILSSNLNRHFMHFPYFLTVTSPNPCAMNTEAAYRRQAPFTTATFNQLTFWRRIFFFKF